MTPSEARTITNNVRKLKKRDALKHLDKCINFMHTKIKEVAGSGRSNLNLTNYFRVFVEKQIYAERWDINCLYRLTRRALKKQGYILVIPYRKEDGDVIKW